MSRNCGRGAYFPIWRNRMSHHDLKEKAAAKKTTATKKPAAKKK